MTGAVLEALTGTVVAQRLDTGQYLALWRWLGLGDKPLLLDTPEHGRTLAERDAADAAAWTRLGAHGWLDARGHPDPALVDVLGVLAAPAVEVDVRSSTGDEMRGALACARGSLGVVAELVDGVLNLGPADPGDLPAAVLAGVPDVPALAGSPISLPTDALLAPAAGLAARTLRLRRAGVPRPTLDRLAAIWAAPPGRWLQFGVARRDPFGVRRRGPRVLTVLDTVAGRLVYGPDPSGTRYELRGVDRASLRRELATLLSAPVTAAGGAIRGVP